MFCFYGQFSYQLDAKGRMRLPAKYRAEIGSEYLLVKGAGGCIAVLHKQLLDTINERISALPISDVEGSKAIRAFTSSAVDVECDEQGRFLLPLTLKQYASIDKNVCIVGAGNKVEIWSQEKWDELSAQTERVESYEEILSGLSKYGV